MLQKIIDSREILKTNHPQRDKTGFRKFYGVRENKKSTIVYINK